MSSTPAAPEGGAERAVLVARRAGQRAALLAVAAVPLVLALAPLSVLVGAVAFVLGLRALLAAQRLRIPARAAIVAICVAPVVVLGGGLVAVGQQVFREELGRYSECLKGANTRIAEAACERELRKDLGDRLGVSLG
jgi:hypothetical protein